MGKPLLALVAVAVAVVSALLVWRRRGAAAPAADEHYESDGMVRVGPVPDAPAVDPSP